jgi:hypothetical protein
MPNTDDPIEGDSPPPSSPPSCNNTADASAAFPFSAATAAVPGSAGSEEANIIERCGLDSSVCVFVRLPASNQTSLATTEQDGGARSAAQAGGRGVMVVFHPYPEEGCELRALWRIKPRFVVLYDAEASFIRQIEVGDLQSIYLCREIGK